MKHKSTLKRGKRFRRHTRKKSAYGGMKSMAPPVKRPLNPNASSFISTAAPEYRPALVPEPVPEPVVDPRVASAVAIDCEMVGVKPGDTSALAHVAIVDINGTQIYNKYVIPRGGVGEITHNRKKYSGINVRLLEEKQISGEALDFDIVKEQVHKILNGRIIVGHGLINDFKVLEYEPTGVVWDTTEIPEYLREPAYPGAQRKAYKLKELAAMIGNNIQRANRGGHSPLEDARASMNLFRTYIGLYKVNYTGRNMSSSY
jgi:RNA exonuclease 4